MFLSEKQCEFVYNAPSASHAGGIWERQIRTVRNVLNVTLAQCPGRLDDASLRTLFYEAMAIVNSRPLTVDGINDPNSLEPLTPNHLILMKSDVALPPPGKFVKDDMYVRNDGVESNTWSSSFGVVGRRSIFLIFQHAKSGILLGETLE